MYAKPTHHSTCIYLLPAEELYQVNGPISKFPLAYSTSDVSNSMTVVQNHTGIGREMIVGQSQSHYHIAQSTMAIRTFKDAQHIPCQNICTSFFDLFILHCATKNFETDSVILKIDR